MKTINTYVELSSFPFSKSAQEVKPNVCANETPLDFLKRKYQRGFTFGLDNLQKTGYYKLMGWAFDFRPFMRKFLVKQYGQWQEYYAPNKTLLRASLYGKVEAITELL